MRKTVPIALKAAEQLAAEGVEAEVVDLRTIRPLDTDTVLDVGAQDEPLRRGRGGLALRRRRRPGGRPVQREGFDELDAPVLRVTGADVPMPYNKSLEKSAKADPAKVIAAVKQGALPGVTGL